MEIAIKYNTKMYEGVMLTVRMGVRKTRVSLLRCLDVTITVKFVLSLLSQNRLFVIQPQISVGQSHNCVR